MRQPGCEDSAGHLLNLATIADLKKNIARPRRGKVTILRVADNKPSGHLSGKKTGDLLWPRTCEGMGIKQKTAAHVLCSLWL